MGSSVRGRAQAEPVTSLVERGYLPDTMYDVFAAVATHVLLAFFFCGCCLSAVGCVWQLADAKVVAGGMAALGLGGVVFISADFLAVSPDEGFPIATIVMFAFVIAFLIAFATGVVPKAPVFVGLGLFGLLGILFFFISIGMVTDSRLWIKVTVQKDSNCIDTEMTSYGKAFSLNGRSFFVGPTATTSEVNVCELRSSLDVFQFAWYEHKTGGGGTPVPRMSKPYNKLGIATTLAGESVYILLNENTLYELNVESFIWKPIEATPPDGVSFTSISKILYEPDTFSLYGDKYLFMVASSKLYRLNIKRDSSGKWESFSSSRWRDNNICSGSALKDAILMPYHTYLLYYGACSAEEKSYLTMYSLLDGDMGMSNTLKLEAAASMHHNKWATWKEKDKDEVSYSPARIANYGNVVFVYQPSDIAPRSMLAFAISTSDSAKPSISTIIMKTSKLPNGRTQLRLEEPHMLVHDHHIVLIGGQVEGQPVEKVNDVHVLDVCRDHFFFGARTRCKGLNETTSKCLLGEVPIPNTVDGDPEPILTSLQCDRGECSGDGNVVADATCLMCGPGNFKDAKRGVCSKCAAGTYNAKFGQNNCLTCPQGKWSAVGEEQCRDCNIACSRCPKGKWSLSTSTPCGSCKAGEAIEKASAGEFSSSCSDCSAGRWHEGQLLAINEGSCKLCVAGKYNSVPGASNVSQCLNCRPGQYGDEQGLKSCKPCPFGTYGQMSNATSAASCMQCPSGRFSASPSGIASVEDCKACPLKHSTMGQPGVSACTECPALLSNLEPGKDCDNYALVTVVGFFFVLMSVGFMYAIYKDPLLYKDDRERNATFQRKFLLVACFGIFDFISDGFYLTTTHFDSSGLLIASCLCMLLPTFSFIVITRHVVRTHFSIILSFSWHVTRPILKKRPKQFREFFDVMAFVFLSLMGYTVLTLSLVLGVFVYVVLLMLFINLKLGSCAFIMDLFFLNYSSSGGDQREENIHLVLNSSVFMEVLLESLPQMFIGLANATSTTGQVNFMFVVFFLSSLLSFLNSIYPYFRHIYFAIKAKEATNQPFIWRLKEAVLAGLKKKRYEDDEIKMRSMSDSALIQRVKVMLQMLRNRINKVGRKIAAIVPSPKSPKVTREASPAGQPSPPAPPNEHGRPPPPATSPPVTEIRAAENA